MCFSQITSEDEVWARGPALEFWNFVPGPSHGSRSRDHDTGVFPISYIMPIAFVFLHLPPCMSLYNTVLHVCSDKSRGNWWPSGPVVEQIAISFQKASIGGACRRPSGTFIGTALWCRNLEKPVLLILVASGELGILPLTLLWCLALDKLPQFPHLQGECCWAALSVFSVLTFQYLDIKAS